MPGMLSVSLVVPFIFFAEVVRWQTGSCSVQPYAQAIVSVCLSFIRLLALVSGIGAGDGFMFYSCTSVSNKSSSASGRCAVMSLRRAVYSDASVLRYYCINATASSTLRIAGCQMVGQLPRLHSPSAKPHHVILAPLFVRLSCVQCMYMCSSNTHAAAQLWIRSSFFLLGRQRQLSNHYCLV